MLHMLFLFVPKGHLIEKITDMKSLSKLVTYVMSPQWQCSACIYTADRQYA